MPPPALSRRDSGTDPPKAQGERAPPQKRRGGRSLVSGVHSERRVLRETRQRERSSDWPLRSPPARVREGEAVTRNVDIGRSHRSGRLPRSRRAQRSIRSSLRLLAQACALSGRAPERHNRTRDVNSRLRPVRSVTAERRHRTRSLEVRQPRGQRRNRRDGRGHAPLPRLRRRRPARRVRRRRSRMTASRSRRDSFHGQGRRPHDVIPARMSCFGGTATSTIYAQTLRNTRCATSATGAGTARPPRATAETCTALTWPARRRREAEPNPASRAEASSTGLRAPARPASLHLPESGLTRS